MKTILVLSAHPDFPETIRAGLDPELYRVVHRPGVEEAEPLLIHGLAAVCILDIDLMGADGVWVIERLRRRNVRLPVIAYTATSQSEWEEEAFLHGVTHVLTKPVRMRLLNSLLERLWNAPSGHEALPAPLQPFPSGQAAQFFRAIEPPADPARFVNAAQTLDMLRDFSSILTHSLDAEAMLKQFLQFLRETLSVNRAAIFLNHPVTPLAEALSPENGRQLRYLVDL